MAQRVVFLVKAYSILMEMFVNADRIDIHLVSTSGA